MKASRYSMSCTRRWFQARRVGAAALGPAFMVRTQGGCRCLEELARSLSGGRHERKPAGRRWLQLRLGWQGKSGGRWSFAASPGFFGS